MEPSSQLNWRDLLLKTVDGWWWWSGLFLALACLVGAWLATNGEFAYAGRSAQVDFGLYTFAASPYYLMCLDLWPRRWNALAIGLRKMFAPGWRIVSLDLLAVSGLVAYPLLGLVFSVAWDSVRPELYGWVWMAGLGAIFGFRRNRMKRLLEDADA